MTNKATSKLGNFGNVVYDSGRDITDGRKRIPISATEIELLDDIPISRGIETNTSRDVITDQTRVFDTQNQSSTYHTLSMDRSSPKANVVYQEGNDQNLTSAVDKLLQKYAPDATPQNLLNTQTSRRPLTQVNVTTVRNEPSASIFQTNPSSTSANNYSTITRPKTGQLPPTQIQVNQDKRQPITRPRPATTYDSFQHTVPQTSQPQQSKSSIPLKTKNGPVTNVVPGKLYTLGDDPLHLLFDRQNPASSNAQQSPFVSTFQPTNNTSINQDPLTILYTNTSQRYPQQPPPITTNTNTATNANVNANGIQPFDLANLIKRVQQDYAREIEPFVSSIKFVEKDREYGQSLDDVGFTTPVTVRKGFTRQADDILRRSFNRQARQRRQMNRSKTNDYSDDDDDDINDLRPSTRQNPLTKIDSKRSFTSVTSTSTYDSEYDNRNSSLASRKNKVDVHNQATSPLQTTNIQPQVQHKGPSTKTNTAVSLKPTITNESDDEVTTTGGNAPAPIKFAQRITSDHQTTPSSDTDISDEEEDYTTTYNEHGQSAPKPSEAINAIATNAPVIPSTDARTRERTNQVPQRSEDIHPAPPTLPSSTNTRTQPKHSDSEESTGQLSGSEIESESDDEDITPAPVNPIPPATTSRSNVQPNTTTARSAVAANTAPPNARESAAQNPPVTARTTADNNARQAAGTGANPNIPFIPPNQRAAVNERGAPQATTTTQAPTTVAGGGGTGSTRFFQSDANNKEKRSIKEAPAAVGNKIKSLFRRK